MDSEKLKSRIYNKKKIMRKTIILIVSILFFNSFVLDAQTDRGRIVVGGTSTFGLMGTGNDVMSIGVSTIKFKSDIDGFEEDEADKVTSINFIPKLGVFAANNLLIGLDISLAYQKNTNGGNSDDTYSRRLISAGPFVRYYFPTNSIKPFIEATSSFGSIKSKSEDEDYSDESTDRLTAFGGGLGVAIPIGDKVSFDILAHYTSFTTKDKEDNDNNTRVVVGTLGLKLGFVVFLGN